jgi:chaperonin GroES
MSVPIQPLADYVVAQPEEVGNKTASGFYVPESAKEQPKISKVIAVGKEVKSVKVGDRIVYGGYTNTDIKVEGTDYQLIKEENIYATVK